MPQRHTRVGRRLAPKTKARLEVPVGSRGWLETLTIVLLLVGGFLSGIGWLIGVVLLWLSNSWTTRDKLIGTLIVPGGLALPVLLALVGMTSSGAQVCTSTATINSTTHAGGSDMTCTHLSGTPLYQQILLGALMVVIFVAPIATAVYLARRSRRLAPA
jgi:hypothetical protein